MAAVEELRVQMGKKGSEEDGTKIRGGDEGGEGRKRLQLLLLGWQQRQLRRCRQFETD